MNISLILSCGSSNRFGSDLPKQYHNICGKQVIAYTVDAMKSSRTTDLIIIVSGEKHVSELTQNYETEVIVGGKTRNESLRTGLDFIKKNFSSCEKILINEAARPFITATIVDEYFALLDNYDAVITAQHITDSLGRNGEHQTDRSEYYLVQAPEAFRFSLLEKHFMADSPVTATNQQLPFGSFVYRNFDFRSNFKITYIEDLAIAEQLMRG